VTAAQGAVSRRQARRAAFVLLYQQDVVGGPMEPLVERYELDTQRPLPAYAREALDGVGATSDALDARIDGASAEWRVERLGAVERAILRLALWELTERDDVPVAVAIDEAVGLAKRYASPEAGALVNGILGRVAREAGRGR
jgi:N utilization substance protein B